MKVHVTLQSAHRGVNAEAIYCGDTITVLPGGKISEDFADYVKGGKKSKSYRDNPEYVDGNRNIIKECVFSSPSTAAQFVTGRSDNGYLIWKVEKKKTLGAYLRENGLR